MELDISRRKWKPLMDSNLASEGVLNGLVRRRRFSDVVLGSWALVERNVNSVFQLTLGIESPGDKRVMIVDSVLSFEYRIRYLRHVGTISDHEFDAIKQFQEDRNDLFHASRGEKLWFFAITRKEKEEVMAHAWHAALASNKAAVRAVTLMIKGE